MSRFISKNADVSGYSCYNWVMGHDHHFGYCLHFLISNSALHCLLMKIDDFATDNLQTEINNNQEILGIFLRLPFNRTKD